MERFVGFFSLVWKGFLGYIRCSFVHRFSSGDPDYITTANLCSGLVYVFVDDKMVMKV